MAYINEYMETSDNTKKLIRVPSAQGGADRTIYVNGSNSGYKLGNSNNMVYSSGGREVAKSLKDFVREMLWVLAFKSGILIPAFLFVFFFVFYIIIFN